MPTETILLIFVLVAGFYMAWNIGANDVANAMGTSVGSGALTLRRAVIIAAILEFSGAFFFGSHVSETIQKGIIRVEVFSPDPYLLVYGMLASLVSTGLWLQMASYFGWPVSGTHAIVGAVIGFGVVVGGVEAVYWDNIAMIVSSWVISPLLGGIISFLIFTALRTQIFYTAHPVQATKRLIPAIVFIVIVTLSLTLIYKGLNNVAVNLNFMETAGISIAAGLIGALISFILVRGIKSTEDVQKSSDVANTEAVISLEKSKKHLLRAYDSSTGETKYQIRLLLDDLDIILNSIQNAEEMHVVSKEYATVEKIFGYLQILSACLMAFAHGANDVANAIGPLAAALSVLSTGIIDPSTDVPAWTLALGGFGIVVGLATWGWRVIETIGKKITELTPTRGFAAEFGAAATVLVASRLGLPISTTHTLVGSVIGVGFARGMEALNLLTTRDIFISWLVTIPVSAGLSIAFFFLFRSMFS